MLSLLFELFIGLLKFLLPYLQFGGQLLRLLQKTLGLHRGLDTVQNDADRRRELIEKRHLQVRERANRSNFDNRFDLPLEEHGKHNDVFRCNLENARADRHDVRRDVGNEQPFLFQGPIGEFPGPKLQEEITCAGRGRLLKIILGSGSRLERLLRLITLRVRVPVHDYVA